MSFMPTSAQGRTHRLPRLMTANNEWLRSVKRDAAWRLRVRTTRWPLSVIATASVSAARHACGRSGAPYCSQCRGDRADRMCRPVSETDGCVLGRALRHRSRTRLALFDN
jgi:hypothetical protein